MRPDRALEQTMRLSDESTCEGALFVVENSAFTFAAGSTIALPAMVSVWGESGLATELGLIL